MAPYSRVPKASSVKRSERVDLPAEHHPTVDTILKELKQVSKRLQTYLTVFDGEIKVLERLYYKGKNQHRPALFWKRVTEMRRYGKRVEQLQLVNFFEDIRLSFFRESNSSQSKVAQIFLDSLSRRKIYKRDLATAIALPRFPPKEEKMQDIFRAFTLEMQTGAFVHLILTVLGISSRLGLLVKDLHSLLVDARSMITRLTAIYQPSAAAKLPDTTDGRAVEDPANELLQPAMPVLPLPTPQVIPVVTVKPRVVVEQSKPTARESKPAKANVTKPGRSKKKRNEIDDIFGNM
ncbi:hypothetical protein VNI00_003395 [Paramarasmius palmivorus]|uniref:Nucleolus and neural progenitor protein-like N-terminal domain-containing protein n=1 Tax=Paramarasmius palmivorus TaxID=297713 RepID=A0AAW0DVS4_9AGAR